MRVQLSAVKRVVAGRPVSAFLLIAIGVLFVTAAIPPLTATDLPPFDSPLFGVVGGILGVGLGAFVVTAATAGRAGAADLVRRSFRWRVPARWYLLALFGVPVAATLMSLAIYGPDALNSPEGGWPQALAEVAAFFLIQLVLFQLAEEIGFTGFLQDRWQDRLSALRLTTYVAFFWALWHVPDHFGEEGWGLEQLVAAPVIFVIEFVSLFFARALFVWLYTQTGRSVLLVAITHASFDASISELSHDVVPGSNTARFLIFSSVIVLAGTAVIVATRGRFAGGSGARGGHRERSSRRDAAPTRTDRQHHLGHRSEPTAAVPQHSRERDRYRDHRSAGAPDGDAIGPTREGETQWNAPNRMETSASERRVLGKEPHQPPIDIGSHPRQETT